LHNQRLGLVKIKDAQEVDRRFLYYVLLSDESRRQLRATATGTTVRHTAPGRIYDVKIRLPAPPEQGTIGRVLGSIDELIANNQRRAALLEAIVRAVYREWFVHFRYPGHEEVPLVDSPRGPIPEGWQATTVGEVLELRYGKALKKDSRRGGTVAVVGSSGVVGWHDEALVAGPSIVVGRKGNVGNIIWLDGDCWPIDTTYFVATDLSLRYAVEQLRNIEFLNTHAAVPGLSRDQAYSRPFLLPASELVDRFTEVAETLASARAALVGASGELVGLRDLLLPKLVSGAIDVSSLDLGLAGATA
jgi:type I restriction enzyme S subunit